MLKVYVSRQRMREILQNASVLLEGVSSEKVDELYERSLVFSDEVEERCVRTIRVPKPEESNKKKKPANFVPSGEVLEVRANMALVNVGIDENPQYAFGREKGHVFKSDY